jgi:hypothetical protein
MYLSLFLKKIHHRPLPWRGGVRFGNAAAVHTSSNSPRAGVRIGGRRETIKCTQLWPMEWKRGSWKLAATYEAAAGLACCTFFPPLARVNACMAYILIFSIFSGQRDNDVVYVWQAASFYYLQRLCNLLHAACVCFHAFTARLSMDECMPAMVRPSRVRALTTIRIIWCRKKIHDAKGWYVFYLAFLTFLIMQKMRSTCWGSWSSEASPSPAHAGNLRPVYGFGLARKPFAARALTKHWCRLCLMSFVVQGW